jgi:hypothetical protein
MPICVLSILILLLAPLCAGAQEAGSIYVVGGAGVNRQDGPSGVSPVTYVTAPGGTTIGWLVGGGVFLTPHLAVDAEVSSTGWMTASEPSRYGYTYHEERRDRFFTLGARFAFPAGAVSIEPVAGVVFTTSDAWTQADRDLSQVSPFPGIEVGGRFEHPLDTGVGIMAGLDVRIGGRHFAAQPSFRVMQTAIDTGEFFDGAPPREIGAIYPGGYPGWTLRAGIALRGDF